MTILTKPNSGAKLCPKPINPENVENGAVIEQVCGIFLCFCLSSIYIVCYIYLCCHLFTNSIE